MGSHLQLCMKTGKPVSTLTLRGSCFIVFGFYQVRIKTAFPVHFLQMSVINAVDLIICVLIPP